MFDLLIKPREAEKRPADLLFFALALGIVSSWLGILIGKGSDIGNLIVALICIGAVPLLVHIIWLSEREAKKDSILTRHWTVIVSYGAYFIGIVLAISVVYTLLPDTISGQVFSPQLQELHAIRTLATGHATSQACGFLCVLQNNLQVLFFVILFSFLYGAGAVYIITWNASIVGVLIGITAEQLSKSLALHESIAYLIALPYSLVRLFPHGIFEISGYLVAGLAGGMMSAAILRGDIKNKRILLDILEMIGLSILLILVGAFIETL